MPHLAMQWTLEQAAADTNVEIAEALRLVRLALSIDGNNAEALSMLGRATASYSGDFEAARQMVDRAVALNPNAAVAWSQRGSTYLIAGQPEEAIRSFDRAFRRSPLDPRLQFTFTGMGMALVELGRFEEAVVAGKKAQRHNTLFSSTYRCLASAFALQRLLSREGHASELHIGVARDGAGFAAHAWLTSAGRILVGEEEREAYKPLVAWPSAESS